MWQEQLSSNHGVSLHVYNDFINDNEYQDLINALHTGGNNSILILTFCDKLRESVPHLKDSTIDFKCLSDGLRISINKNDSQNRNTGKRIIQDLFFIRSNQRDLHHIKTSSSKIVLSIESVTEILNSFYTECRNSIH